MNHTKTRNIIPDILIGLAGFACALAALYLISSLIHFKYHDLDGIVSRISTIRYPKDQDIFYFCLAFVLVPSITALCWWVLNRGRRENSETQREREDEKRPFASHLPLLLDYLLIPTLIYLFFFGGFINQGPYSAKVHGTIDLFHEGERLAPLNELLRGKIPYKDIYIQHGLFQNAYKPLIASKLFGVSISADRTLNKILEPLAYLFVYILGRQLLKTRTAALALILTFCGKDIWASDRYILSFIAIALLAAYMKKLPTLAKPLANPLVTASGFFTSLAIFYSLDIGLYTLATCGLMTILLTFRKTSPTVYNIDNANNANNVGNVGNSFIVGDFFSGLLIGFAPFGLYFLMRGALDDLFENSFVQCYYQLQIWGLPFPSIKPHLGKFLSVEGIKELINGQILAWYLPVGIYLAAASFLLIKFISKKYQTRDYLMLLALLAGIISFRSTLGRSDIHHVKYAMPYFWICCMIIAERFGSFACKSVKSQLSSLRRLNLNLTFQSLVSILILALFAGYLMTFHNPIGGARAKLQSWLSSQNADDNLVNFENDRSGGVKIPPQQRDDITNTVDYIQQQIQSSETIFDFSNQGGYYFFANRPSPTKYHQISYASTKKMQLEVIADLEKHKPKLLIFKTGNWFDNIDGIDNIDRNYLVADYLKSRYAEETVIGKVVILKRRSEHLTN